MTRRSKLTALLCAQSFLLVMALPALADPPTPAAPDGGPDYVLQPGVSISHSWNPGSAAGSGIQSSSAMGQAQTFSTGGSGGRGGESGAQSLVIAHKKAASQAANPTGATSDTTSTSPIAELRNLVKGASNGYVFTPAGQEGPKWIITPDSGSGVVVTRGDSTVDVTTANQSYPMGESSSVDITGFDSDTDSIQGTFVKGGGESASYTELTGSPYSPSSED